MRIIYWVGTLGSKFGSLERYLVLLAEVCKENRHEIVFIHESPNIVTAYKERLRNAQADLVVIPNSYKDPWQALFSAAKFVKLWKPDLVNTHFVNPVALPMLKLLNVPLLYQTYHSGIDHKISLKTRIIRWRVQLCTKRIFAVSNRVRNDEIRAGVSPSHISTLPLGLAIRDFLNSTEIINGPYPKGFNDPNKKIIITVGHFFPEKGMRYIVEAAVEVLQKRQDVIWWLVGKDGPEKEYSWSLVEQAELTEKILFLGQRNDVAALMKKAYLQVVGSLYEGLGLMAIESSALGVPLVGTQIGGLDEAILDGKTGLLVPKCSGHELAIATIRLLDDKKLRDQLGLAAKKHVQEHFDAEKLVNDLLDTYEKDFNNTRNISK